MRVAFAFRVLTLLALGAASLLPAPALAADYPDRPVRWVVPYSAGGTTDVIARNVAHTMSQMFGHAEHRRGITPAAHLTGHRQMRPRGPSNAVGE